jgi:hypothetical protein
MVIEPAFCRDFGPRGGCAHVGCAERLQEVPPVRAGYHVLVDQRNHDIEPGALGADRLWRTGTAIAHGDAEPGFQQVTGIAAEPTIQHRHEGRRIITVGMHKM